MPELPEVETTCRGIAPFITAKVIQAVVLRHTQLRYPLSVDLHLLHGQRFLSVVRRGKYLLFETERRHFVLMHLGMSGSLRLVTLQTPLQKHDHVDIVFDDNTVLRYHDPRRFGLWLWLGANPQHPLLANLGPEPLSDRFNGAYVFQATRTTKVALKKWLMNSAAVVGVGNIYANEALFLAKLLPQRMAQTLTLVEAKRLVLQVQAVLSQAIAVGGTTLKDFVGSDGKPGYFAFNLQAYGRGGLECGCCQALLTEIRLDNRTTVYCQQCQR